MSNVTLKEFAISTLEFIAFFVCIIVLMGGLLVAFGAALIPWMQS